FEGCRFRFFANGAQVAVAADDKPNSFANYIDTFIFRRNIIVDNSAQGVMISSIKNFTLEENIFDRNYFGTSSGNTDHNFYIGGYNPDATYGGVPPQSGTTSYAHARGNISTRDPSGSHFRSGGIITDNFFAYDDWPFDVGALIGGPTTSVT